MLVLEQRLPTKTAEPELGHRRLSKFQRFYNCLDACCLLSSPTEGTRILLSEVIDSFDSERLRTASGQKVCPPQSLPRNHSRRTPKSGPYHDARSDGM